MHVALQAPKHALAQARLPRITMMSLRSCSGWQRRGFSRTLPRHHPREQLLERFASLVVQAKSSRALQELMAQREEKEEEQTPVGEAPQLHCVARHACYAGVLLALALAPLRPCSCKGEVLRCEAGFGGLGQGSRGPREQHRTEGAPGVACPCG